MSKPLILPSLLAANPLNLAEEITAVEAAGADMLHYDVMDGHYVPNLSMGPPHLSAIRQSSSLPIDVHLMISNPEATVDSYIDAGADIISVHPEVATHLHRLLQHIIDRGKRAAVALNPADPWELVEWVLPLCHHVLVMTVNPGYGGQKFISEMLPKIEALRKHIDQRGLATHIEVDGGITSQTAGPARQAGADMLVAGTAIFGAKNYRSAITAFKSRPEQESV